MTDMTGILILLGGMVAFATVIGVWDLIAERRARRERLKPHNGA